MEQEDKKEIMDALRKIDYNGTLRLYILVALIAGVNIIVYLGLKLLD